MKNSVEELGYKTWGKVDYKERYAAGFQLWHAHCLEHGEKSPVLFEPIPPKFQRKVEDLHYHARQKYRKAVGL